MHRTRLATLVASLACALLLGSAATASAQTTSSSQPLAKRIPVTGVVKKGPQSGKKFNGMLKIKRFVKRSGTLYAVGTLKGTLRHRTVSQRVSMPVSNPSVAGAQGAKSAQLPPIAGACQILNLQLGPINLNLLGLVVRTNAINIRIDAVPGPGNLLGNLLCGITNLLNPGSLSGTPLGQLVNILNALLALSPATA